MDDGFQISLWGAEATAVGIWGMMYLILFVFVLGAVLHLLPVLKNWLQRKLK